MASDNFSWDVIIRLATQGAKGSADDLQRVGDAVDRLQKSGGLTEKQMESHTRAINRAGQASKTVAKDTTALQKAQEGLKSALSDQAFSRQTSELDKVAQAQARVARAVESRKSAEASLGNARGGGGEAQATKNLTAAIKEQTAAENALAAAREAQINQAVSLRYANYDLASSMLAVSAGITALGVGAVGAFASQERAFADVIRTTTDDVGQLESVFRDLSTAIPFSFNQLAEIGTLGNQLGVAGSDLEAFTRTIAEFSTVTGITAEQSALAFGKLGNLLGVSAQDYDRLASAIALVGRETAATEQQIISVAGEIAPAAAAAGFTADQVIGLSGALSSLKVPPERSRSTILQFFETLNNAVASGGDKLENFAAVVGVTASDLEGMVRAGQGEDILTRFIGNVSTADTVEITQALQNLGLAGLRTNPTIRALAGNMNLLTQSLADGKKGWTENTELQRQMDIILSTLSAKWQIFLNAATNVAATIGSAVAPAFADLIGYLTEALVGLQKFAESDFGQGFFRIVGGLSATVAAYAALRGAIALASAGLLGFAFISRQLSGAGIIAGLQGMASAFGLVTGSSTAAAGGLTAVRFALTRLLASTGVGVALVLVGSALTDLRGTTLAAIDAVQWLLDTFGSGFFTIGNFYGLFYGIVNVMKYLAGATGSATEIINFGFSKMAQAFSLLEPIFRKLDATIRMFVQRAVATVQQLYAGFVETFSAIYQALAPVFQAIMGIAAGFVQNFIDIFRPIIGVIDAFGAGFGEGLDAFGAGLNQQLESARDWAKTLPSLLDDMDSFTPAALDAGAATGDWAGNLDDLGGAADDASGKIRTLVDYANDLQSVFSRAFDLRFAGGSTLDAITSTFITIREASEESARNIAKMKAEIQGLQSDLSIQKYFLGIAIEYGDTKRAEAIQANIAKLQSELADKSADLSDEQDKNSKTLTGNTKAAIANRTQMEQLVKQYQDHLVALASSGLSQAELARRTAELREQFIQQAVQLGYSRTEVEKYAAAFDDMRIIIDRLPRNITLSVDANPAIQALREYEASINSARANAGRGIALGAISNPTNGAEVRRGGLEASLAAAIARIKELIAAGQVSGPEAIAANNRIQDLVNRLRSGNYWTGGYTGSGGKYEPAGVVHRGEYVIPKKDVNQRTGLPYADALGRLNKGIAGSRGYANGGYVQPTGGMGAGQIASLGPMAMQQFGQLFDAHMRVYLDGRTLSQNASQQFAHSTAQGAM